MFYDFIDSDIIIKFGNIDDGKLRTELLINDRNIKIEYSDLVKIQTN